ncbi:MAG: App1 family protein [Phycisphaerales bacterium]|nr:MAG: App1 family protein [Phycisphaerales bacterium]
MSPDLQRISEGCPREPDDAGRTAQRVVRVWSRGRLVGGVVCVCLLVVAGGLLGGRSLDSSIADDEHVVFFPTFGYLALDRASWVIQIHGWISEPELDSSLRNASLGILRRLSGLEKDEAETATFKERARAFLVDNERGKRISIRLGEKLHLAGISGPSGHFKGTIRLAPAEVKRLLDAQEMKDGWLRFEAITRDEDSRRFAGRVQLIGHKGLSVISDIDDTIKISQVTDYRALLKNTFLREFEPVPGMVEVYRSWAAAGACFHYVSASPWQLYEPLSAFLQTVRFPAGTFHLKSFRLKDSTAMSLFASPEGLKRDSIESILSAFPQRRFILVGDSGEKDPEIYGALARDHPDQVALILIHDVTSEPADCQRYQEAFAGIAKDRWTVFRHAEELDVRLP